MDVVTAVTVVILVVRLVTTGCLPFVVVTSGVVVVGVGLAVVGMGLLCLS